MSRGKASGREGWLSNAVKPVAELNLKIVSGVRLCPFVSFTPYLLFDSDNNHTTDMSPRSQIVIRILWRLELLFLIMWCGQAGEEKKVVKIKMM